MSNADGSGEISAQDAIRETDAGGLLLDVREQYEWDLGHAPAARLIPLSQLGDRLNELPDDTRIMVVCHLGERSRMAASGLVRLGYDAVNVSGGMVAWHSAGGEIVSEGAESPRVD